jgi:hypothetical protein
MCAWQLLEDHKDRGERIKMLIAEKGRREGDEQRSRDKMEALEKERATLQESLHSTSARAKVRSCPVAASSSQGSGHVVTPYRPGKGH